MSNAWRVEALCAEIGPEAFFPERGEDVEPARSICEACPVIEPCREYALAHNVRGIWGGLTWLERKNLRRAAA